MLKKTLNKITQNKDLTRQEAADLIDCMSAGEANPAQIGAFLAAIKTKGETIEEITGFAQGMREKALKINTDGIEIIVDSCGTGGDGTDTFNISTAAAIVAAACGLNVAKHSNYKITGNCGSSNVLEALNIPLLKDPAEVEASLRENSIAFIHAPYFHSSTKNVNTVRKELGIRTIFNFLGPLTNPVNLAGQVIGVSSPVMLNKIAHVLKNLGCKRAMVVAGIDPVLDEISVCGPTQVAKLEEGEIKGLTIWPKNFGIDLAGIDEIKGGGPEVNAGIIRAIFSNEIKGAKLDIVLLNSAAVLWAGQKVSTLEEGVQTARKAIEEGKVLEKLNSIADRQ